MGNNGLRRIFFGGDLVESPYRTLHDIKVVNLDKEEITLGDHVADKYVLIVNTGS